MAAEILSCPMCGAATSSEATRCEHCGARLATVACPSCFGMMFVGSKFCSHCGAQAERTEVAATSLPCPRCKVQMESVLIGTMNLKECPHCEGIWADAASLDQICADRERQAAVLGLASPMPASEGVALEANIRYVPCPVCNKLMNRVNFARCSNVVVDVCKGHGTWFDKDELRRIVEFIRAGGLDAARARELAELEERQQQLKNAQLAQAFGSRLEETPKNYHSMGIGISVAADLLKTLFR